MRPINFKWIAKSLLLASLIVGFTLPMAPVAQAQSNGDIEITFAGQKVSGPEEAIAHLMLGAVRPMVATAELSDIVDTGALSPVRTTASCFGVTEKKDGWSLLKETRFMTDLSNGRYEAVVPSNDQHGDWPPHGILFQLQASSSLACDELVADISYRMRFAPHEDTTLAYTFKLNAKEPEAYKALASGEQLGLFVSSVVPIEVNYELLGGRACHDCIAHTVALTDTIGAGVYDAGTLAWQGEITEGDDIAFDEMYVLPVPEDYSKEWNIVINAPAGAIVWIWTGVFIMPE